MNEIRVNKFASSIFLLLILWNSVQVNAQIEPAYISGQFASFDSLFGWVLRRHVIKTFYNVDGVGRCIVECSRNEYCYSLNFYSDVSVCELNSVTYASHPGDYVSSSNGNFVLYILRSATTCDDSFCTPNKRCFFKKYSTISLCRDCSKALGMEDRTIPDSAIMSSSTYGFGDSPIGGKYARLNNVATEKHVCCWAADWRFLSAGQFLQIDLGKVKFVTKVATQGRDGNQFKFVTKYTMNWNIDGEAWQEYKENGVVKVFNGNFDQLTVVTNIFKQKLVTRHVRLVVQEWQGFIELRMELYGCSI